MYWLNKMLSWSLYAAVIVFMIFALSANFLIIAQGIFEPLSVVKGGSMNPTIEEDDAVFLTNPDTSRLSVGDIVVFNDPDNYTQSIIHRIVGIEEEDGEIYAMTKGDANEIADPFMIPLESIHGKVRFIVPAGGVFISYLRSMPGFITCVICPFAVLLLYLISKRHLEKCRPGQSIFAFSILPDARP